MTKLEIGFNDEMILKDGYHPNEAYSIINELMIKNHFKSDDKKNYICEDSAGFVGAMAVVIDIIEHNYWFKPYINVFKFEDEESSEDLLEEYLESLETFPLHGILEN